MYRNDIRFRHPNNSYIYSYRAGRSDTSAQIRHVHEYYEFLQLIEGRGKYIVEGNEYEIRAGDLLITNPYEFHAVIMPENSVYVRQFFQIDTAFVAQLRPQIFALLNARPFGLYNRICADEVRKYGLDAILDGVAEYVELQNADTDFMVLTYAAQLIIRVSQLLADKYGLKKAPVSKHIAKLYRYIDGHLTDDIKLGEIAEHLFLDKSHMCRLFKQETGRTLNSYISMRRVTLAKTLLLAGEKPNNIYRDCGFNEYSTFYRAFRKYTGLSPEQFVYENR